MSPEDEYFTKESSTTPLPGSKKRRLQRACDICRRKKIRCDSAQMPGYRCSNCIAFNSDCTHTEPTKKRGPRKGYVEDLEQRLEAMEALLHKMCPDGNLQRELDSLHTGDRLPDLFSGKMGNSSAVARNPSSSPAMAYSSMPSDVVPVPAESSSSNDDELVHIALAEHLKRLSIDGTQERFFGKSSGFMLMQTAMDIKKEYSGDDAAIKGGGFKRPVFWDLRPWEQVAAETKIPHYVYPDQDLIATLVTIYFVRVNPFFPLLHQPTFEKSIVEGLHVKNHLFGATLLLVCAVASRYSSDPRVFLEGAGSEHSCGWKWFSQVQLIRNSFFDPPSLWELQSYCLSVLYMHGTSTPQACWMLVGLGLRMAQEVGAHRRKPKDHKLTVEGELRKRAFWVLVSMDRMVSSFLGRPCAIQDEDFDVDLPVECDDEYWEHPDPEMAFKQPPDRPSIISYFNSHLKLYEVLAFTLRTIYSTNKSKIFLGLVGQQWEQRIVAELDSALNKWIDSVPDHLRWDSNREHQIFFDQSASLFTSYYHLQIQIHRPFIPSPNKSSPLSFPSLAICTNAARSCCHVVDIQGRRGVLPFPHMQVAVFTSGIVLLLNIWGGRRSGLVPGSHMEMADVHKCIQMLKVCEQRWQIAGRLYDMLNELASMGDSPPPPTSLNSQKYKRGTSGFMPTRALDSSLSHPDFTKDPRSEHAPSKENAVAVTNPTGQSRGPNLEQIFTLPMSSDELGRLPLHGHFTFPTYEDTLDSWYRNGLPVPEVLNQSICYAARTPNNIDLSNIPSSLPFDELVFDEMSVGPTGALTNAPYQRDNYKFVQSGDRSAPLNPVTLPTTEIMDSDTMAVWSDAPTGFNLEDWGAYIASVNLNA